MQLLSTKMQLQWRRTRVLELSSQGYTQIEIATRLQVDEPTISRDMAYLRQQAQQSLHKHIHETVPEEYQKCMAAMKQNLKHILEIGDKSADPRIKLEAKKIANETLRYIMELVTGGVVCTEAFKAVTYKQEQIDTLQKLDERIKENEQASADNEEAATTNGVF